MIPSVLSSQIRRGVEDFLQTTFPSSNRFFHNLLDRLSTALCARRNATNVFSLSRAVSAAFFFPRLGITTVGT